MTFLPLTAIGTEPSLADSARIASEDISSRLAKVRSARVILHESARNGRAHTFVAQGTAARFLRTLV